MHGRGVHGRARRACRSRCRCRYGSSSAKMVGVSAGSAAGVGWLSSGCHKAAGAAGMPGASSGTTEPPEPLLGGWVMAGTAQTLSRQSLAGFRVQLQTTASGAGSASVAGASEMGQLHHVYRVACLLPCHCFIPLHTCHTDMRQQCQHSHTRVSHSKHTSHHTHTHTLDEPTGGSQATPSCGACIW